MKELRCVSGDTVYNRCHQLVQAILLAKRHGIEEPELNARLLSFNNCALLQQQPKLSALQRQTAQAFVGVVYSVDNYFDMERRSLFGVHGMLKTEAGTRYTRIAWHASEGGNMESVCREICRREGLKGEVVTRNQLPKKWGDLITCMTIFSKKAEK